VNLKTMQRREFVALASGLALSAPAARAAKPASAGPWLARTRTFADTLLRVGLDHYGPKTTPAWAGVIDTRDWSVPQKGVPAAPGIRESDRAVGGANLYLDSVTLRVFQALSDLTGDRRYRRAADDYMRWFLTACQSPQTGLLAWGEHLYYDFFRDAVAVERKNHELMEWSPPWDLLWAVNPKAVARAIDGLRYHHFEDKPGSLYNRHARFDVAEHQKRQGAQPWIKHSAEYAYSFAFLYSKTQERRWLEWALGDGGIYWERRNPQTGLTLGCIDDPRPGSKLASGQMGLLAYWLRKAGALVPSEPSLREHARALMHAWERHSYDAARGNWRTALNLDGSPASEAVGAPWQFAYGESELLPYGRVAAYFARVDNDRAMLDTARRVARLAAATEVPVQASIEGLGMAINLALDLHELEPEGAVWLKDAERYATLAVERFWRQSGDSGLFVRLTGDPYYESKTGVGFVLAGLLRLNGALTCRPLAGDWTL
jgi:hypothetical protein